MIARQRETRTRIAEAALGLFVSHGFEETTIDQIADTAGVNRRTVFRHFATKEAILFDHLAVKRDYAMRRLEERPHDEPPLISLHAVLRGLCEQGYERPLLNQIRLVLAIEPRLRRRAVVARFSSIRGEPGDRAQKAEREIVTRLPK